MKFNVVQLGARRHYAVPRILYGAGLLHHLYTDICATQGWPKYLSYWPKNLIPKPLQRLSGRVPEGIPADSITSYPGFALWHQIARSRYRSEDDILRADIEAVRRMDRRILRGLSDGDLENTVFYFMERGSEELMGAVKNRGGTCVMEQAAPPVKVDRRLILEESRSFPDWKNSTEVLSNLHWFSEMEERLWNLADLIVCGSDFVRQSIEECGGPVERCRVVPSGIDGRFYGLNRTSHKGPLRVLTVGIVGLRKGSPYVLNLAKSLKGKAVFRMVGPFHGEERVRDSLDEHLQFRGQIPRVQIAKEFEWADVFFLPSLSEGSALVVYEALSAGLPVVCTPNTGSVVRNGYNGFVVPIRDVDAMRASLERLADDRALLDQFSRNAKNSYSDWSFENYRDRLVKTVREFSESYSVA